MLPTSNGQGRRTSRQAGQTLTSQRQPSKRTPTVCSRYPYLSLIRGRVLYHLHGHGPPGKHARKIILQPWCVLTAGCTAHPEAMCLDRSHTPFGLPAALSVLTDQDCIPSPTRLPTGSVRHLDWTSPSLTQFSPVQVRPVRSPLSLLRPTQSSPAQPHLFRTIGGWVGRHPWYTVGATLLDFGP